MMIRTLFKSRYWWLFHDKEEVDKTNFMWTQLRKNGIMGNLRCKLFNAKDKQPGGGLSSGSGLGSLGTAITQNAALMTPNAGKVKRRKISSAKSRSPEIKSDTAGAPPQCLMS